MTDTHHQQQTDVDVVVVGAGFAGLYLLHRLRTAGFRARVLEAADDVGGTWYWNRYPGARCDIPTTDYTYSFDPELEQAWTWSEKYATQPEILRYAQFVAERYDLRRDITFGAKVTQATWDEAARTWVVETDTGERIRTRFHVMATGCLSVPKELDIPGAGRFDGPTYFTSRWPHDGVDFTGKRVAVIGTGSSGIQSIPLIAKEAAQLTVFQRTPNFSVPAHNGPRPAEAEAKLAADREAYRQEARLSAGGVPKPVNEATSATTTADEQRARFEKAWEAGELFEILGVLADQGVNPAANQIVAEMIREKIREIVDDPETAEALCPKDHYFGTKRPCLDTGYYATFNLPHVRLVDLKKTPIRSITGTGIDIEATDGEGTESLEFDAIVFATGFDAMTGALVGVDIAGRDGVTLKQKWAEGPVTYLGLTTVGFPNLFMLTGPESPSVLSNMAVSIEQHVDWVADCIAALREGGFEVIEPTPTAEAGWHQHNADCGAITLHPTANSWYMGANVPGKPRVMLPYIGGVGRYRLACDEVVARGYLGFRLSGPGGEQCNDGLVRELQPDVAMVLDAMAEMGVPAIETMEPAAARELMAAMATVSPPGPEVGEVVDGTLPGPAGDLAYRLWRPATPGPHPLMVWFHGGGWVLGSATSDEPLCRDLCVRTDAVVVSVDYRHAPEAVFPAAFDDAVAAVRWVGEHLSDLGGAPGSLAVGGWSAGGGLTAAVAQHLRDTGGPELAFQFMLTPVTDQSRAWPSMQANGDGYVLTRGLMEWFMGHYTPDPARRADPRVSPLLGRLEGLPPAVLVTAQFDPLRDEGDAY
ncbi:MAG TPA: alpha/beta hydrolase fold domain-containing protein, partial [Acidimicrobiales bacterium]|nr:alpha/beta hydrolase fold domain-containing protein [Acidimicrobiales bacterium]